MRVRGLLLLLSVVSACEERALVDAGPRADHAQWVDGSDRFFGDEKNPRPATAAGNDFDWRVLSWELIAPPEARRVLLWLTAHHPGRVDFDNVSITLAPW